jgi:hypothetical protein
MTDKEIKDFEDKEAAETKERIEKFKIAMEEFTKLSNGKVIENIPMLGKGRLGLPHYSLGFLHSDPEDAAIFKIGLANATMETILKSMLTEVRNHSLELAKYTSMIKSIAPSEFFETWINGMDLMVVLTNVFHELLARIGDSERALNGSEINSLYEIKDKKEIFAKAEEIIRAKCSTDKP